MHSNNNVVKIDFLTENEAKQILKEIIKTSNNIKVSRHVSKRMEERGINMSQIIRVLERGIFVEAPHRTPNGNWKMTLSAISAGQHINVVCALDYKEATGNYAVVITTYFD